NANDITNATMMASKPKQPAGPSARKALQEILWLSCLLWGILLMISAATEGVAVMPIVGNPPHDLGRDRRRSLYIDPHQGRVRARCGPCSWFLFGRGWRHFGLLIWTAQEKSARLR